MNNIKYVGMDVHKSITVIVVLNELGHFESRSQIKTKGENICDFFRGISGKVEVVFEEGTHSAWLYKLLKPLVASVTVCDPRHNKLIEDGNKSDDEDAETLAQLLRLGAVKAIYKGDDQHQQLKEICRAYDNLIEDSTRVQNRLKAIYRGRGISCSGHDLYRADRVLAATRRRIWFLTYTALPQGYIKPASQRHTIFSPRTKNALVKPGLTTAKGKID